jgi:hypothetical protein
MKLVTLPLSNPYERTHNPTCSEGIVKILALLMKHAKHVLNAQHYSLMYAGFFELISLRLFVHLSFSVFDQKTPRANNSSKGSRSRRSGSATISQDYCVWDQ